MIASEHYERAMVNIFFHRRASKRTIITRDRKRLKRWMLIEPSNGYFFPSARLRALLIETNTCVETGVAYTGRRI